MNQTVSRQRREADAHNDESVMDTEDTQALGDELAVRRIWWLSLNAKYNNTALRVPLSLELDPLLSHSVDRVHRTTGCTTPRWGLDENDGDTMHYMLNIDRRIRKITCGTLIIKEVRPMDSTTLAEFGSNAEHGYTSDSLLTCKGEQTLIDMWILNKSSILTDVLCSGDLIEVSQVTKRTWWAIDSR